MSDYGVYDNDLDVDDGIHKAWKERQEDMKKSDYAGMSNVWMGPALHAIFRGFVQASQRTVEKTVNPASLSWNAGYVAAFQDICEALDLPPVGTFEQPEKDVLNE